MRWQTGFLLSAVGSRHEKAQHADVLGQCAFAFYSSTVIPRTPSPYLLMAHFFLSSDDVITFEAISCKQVNCLALFDPKKIVT